MRGHRASEGSEIGCDGPPLGSKAFTRSGIAQCLLRAKSGSGRLVLKSELGQNPGKHDFCDCAMWFSDPGSFLNFRFPHTRPALPVYLRFNLKSFSFIPISAVVF